jgi:general secretion pathway protein C
MNFKTTTLLNSFLAASLGLTLSFALSSYLSYKLPLCVKLPQLQPLRGKKPEYSYDFLLERKGFFAPTSAPSRKEKPKEPVKESVVSSLFSYRLTGTVVCGECGHSLAILSKGGKTLILSEGRELNGYRLQKVLPDRAVFVKGSERVVLKLFQKRKGKVPPSGPSVPTLNPFGFTPSNLQFTVSRKEVLKEISSGQFLNYINIVPVKNPEGLRVNYVNPRSFIYKLGIRPGDVILSINGIRIRTPEDSFSAFEQLKSADSVTVVVLRRGKEVKLHYEIE